MENFDFDTVVQVLRGAIDLICQLIQIGKRKEKRLKRKKLKRRHRKEPFGAMICENL